MPLPLAHRQRGLLHFTLPSHRIRQGRIPGSADCRKRARGAFELSKQSPRSWQREPRLVQRLFHRGATCPAGHVKETQRLFLHHCLGGIAGRATTRNRSQHTPSHFQEELSTTRLSRRELWRSGAALRRLRHCYPSHPTREHRAAILETQLRCARGFRLEKSLFPPPAGFVR